MYYSDEIVEELRSRADIVDVIGSYVALRKKGANYFGLCPFHGEKTASFSVAPGKQIFYCFGCGKGGDVVKFLMEYENLTFQEALQQLAERIGYKLPEDSGGDPERRRENDLRTQLLEINRQAAMYFYGILKSRKGALGADYLKKRGLSEECITHWGLGYAEQSRDGLYRYLRGKGYPEELLRETGLFSFSERGIYDKFFNRVIFPILDANSRVIGFGGRVMGEGEPKYLNSPETKLFEKSRNLFGLNFAKKSRQSFFLLCEGYMDVISLHQAGFSNAVASLGTALTEQQARLMKRYVSEVILTYDSDNAGVKAAQRALPILREAGITARILDLRPYKDPDELIKSRGQEEFQKRIDSAKNSFLWEVEVLKRSYDLQDPAGQTAYFNEIGNLLAGRFPELLERESYLKAVAREQLIDLEGLRKLAAQKAGERGMLLRQKSYAHHSGFEKKGQKKAESAVRKSEKQLITWLSERPEIIELVEKHVKPEELSDEVCREVLPLVYSRLPVNTILDRFREDDSVYEQVAALFNGNLLPEEMDEFAFKRGLEDVIRNIRLHALNERIEKETDGRRLTELFREQSELENLHF